MAGVIAVSDRTIWDRLVEAVTGKSVVPPVPEGKAVILPVQDDELEIVAAEPLPVLAEPENDNEPIPLAIFIEYIDAKGEGSARRILCRKIDLDAGTILAFCHERTAMRCFRIDRIQTAWSVETGEEYPLGNLPQRLINGGLPTEDKKLVRLLTILVYLMRCDHFVVREELEMLERAVTSYVLRYGGDDAAVESALDLAVGMAPSDRDFLLAVRWVSRLAGGGQFAAFVRQWSHQIVIADGVLTHQEAAAGHVIDAALRTIEAGEVLAA